MKFRYALAVLAAIWASLPIWMLACSTTTVINQIVEPNDATANDATGAGRPDMGAGGSVDAGADTGRGGTADAGNGGAGDSGGEDSRSDSGTIVDCGRPPKLLDAAAPGLHCPNVIDGGLPADCPAGNHCCEQSTASGRPSTCAPSCSGTDAEADWACQDPSQCPGLGMACCGSGTVVPVPGCGYANISAFTGSHCAQSCLPAEFRICERPTECPTGQTCIPAKAHGGQLGACQ